VRGHPLIIAVGEASDHYVKPGRKLVVPAAPDLDPGGRDLLGRLSNRDAEHVLERHEPVAARCQLRTDLWVRQIRELYLHSSAARAEATLDLLKLGLRRHPIEAQPGDLVERRVLVGEAGHTAGQRHRETGRRRAAPARRLAASGNERGLGAFDPPRQRGVAEQGHLGGGHVAKLSLDAPADRLPPASL
jgi:hypothetical protein